MKQSTNKRQATDEYIEYVSEEIRQAEEFRKSGKIVSDICDGNGHQFVDLVQEGGGVLGIALVGYTYIMEKAGIRFFSLAGTSAGAINTLMLAAVKEDTRTKSEKILGYMVNKDLFEIVDGDRVIKKFIHSFLNNRASLIRLRTIFVAIRALLIIRIHLGINPGKNFEEWIESILAENGIRTHDDLIAERKQMPDLIARQNVKLDGLKRKLVMVASDITTQTKVEFPEMAELYWKNYGTVNPARYLRASMSIPLFFRPVKIKNVGNDEESRKRWRELVQFEGKDIPGTIRLVDGGLLSNFPINVFHNEKIVPRMPTFGVRLSAYREKPNKTGKPTSLLWSIIKTMKQLYDTDFLIHHDDYKRLICHLDTDNDYNWLDFNMAAMKRKELFRIGAKGAINFLEKFDWEGYKDIRRELLNKSPEYVRNFVARR